MTQQLTQAQLVLTSRGEFKAGGSVPEPPWPRASIWLQRTGRRACVICHSAVLYVTCRAYVTPWTLPTRTSRAMLPQLVNP